jgi:hypothetical protein
MGLVLSLRPGCPRSSEEIAMLTALLQSATRCYQFYTNQKHAMEFDLEKFTLKQNSPQPTHQSRTSLSVTIARHFQLVGFFQSSIVGISQSSANHYFRFWLLSFLP